MERCSLFWQQRLNAVDSKCKDKYLRILYYLYMHTVVIVCGYIYAYMSMIVYVYVYIFVYACQSMYILHDTSA